MSDAQTHFLAHCPHCSAGLRIRRAYLGQQVKCKQCDQAFVAEEGPVEAGGVPGETPAMTSPAAQADRIVVTCPGCNATLNVRRAYIGRQVRCKQCDKPFLVADPSGPPLSGLWPDRASDDHGREAPSEELERLRGELEQSTAENRRLHAELDGIRPELERIGAEHERLRGAHGELKAVDARRRASQAELQAAHDTLAAGLEEARAERDHLASENERLAGDRDRLQLERNQLERERDEHLSLEHEAQAAGAELRAMHAELSVERDSLQADRDRIRAERDRLEVDLQILTETLDGIPPGQVRPMAEERASLQAEVEGLRDEVGRLLGEVERFQAELASSSDRHAALERLSFDRQHQWETELLAARAEADRLGTVVRDRDADLEKARSERDRLRVEKADALAEADALRVAAGDAATEADRLRAALARLEREQQEQGGYSRAEIDRLRAEVDRLGAELEPLRHESDRLAALVRDREAALASAVAERDRLSVEKESARIEAARLRMSFQQLEREQLDRSEEDRAEIERLGLALDRLQEENDRLREANEQLRTRIDRCTTTAASPDGDEPLRDAQAKVMALQQELANLRRIEREMRGMLAGIGIRFRET